MCVRCILDDSLHHKDHTNGICFDALVELFKFPPDTLDSWRVSRKLPSAIKSCSAHSVGGATGPTLLLRTLSLKGTNDPGRTRAGPGPAQCRCPLWAAIGRRLARNYRSEKSPEGLLRPAAVGTTRRALRAAMPTAGSRFAARRAVQFAWFMHAGNLQAARQPIACDGLAGPRSVC